ncbi:MAG TPA: hypothetical protein O0X97_03175 [Methanocorpusculum sp.]|nr:hypothetical protein [Methanocorpusculum sp.]
MKGYGSFGGSYEGVEPVQYLFGDDKILHYLQPWDSNITVEHTATSTTEPAGRTTAIDTLWAFEGQKVKIAVSPASGYSVYGWNVYECGMSDGTIYKQFTPSEDYIVKSTDPEDGATTYILTMPKIEVGHSVAVEPLLRDQGSTIVTYVFLDADTYVMEVPADFNIKKMNVPVAEKMVNLTDCELLDGHVLSVDLDSYNGYRDIGLGFNTFVMQNIAGSSYAGYTIDEKKIYKNATAFSEITSNNVEILSTSGMTPVQVDEKVSEGNMKTELQFTLKGLGSYASLGKYKDQLTFTVSIDE